MAKLESPVLLATERQLTDSGVAKVSSGQLPKGTLLMSSRAPIGYLAISEIPVSVNQGIIAIVSGGTLNNHFVLHWAHTNMNVIEANANGSTFLEISKRNFRQIPVLVPESECLSVFDQKVSRLHSRTVGNMKISRTLAALRDVLLPKLISGELRVQDAEAFLARSLNA